MKLTVSRFAAILILVIFGIMASYGFLLMKNSIFAYISAFGDENLIPSLAWGPLIGGFLLFIIGVGFIGGWIFYRDRKRNYVAPRFKKKRKRPDR